MTQPLLQNTHTHARTSDLALAVGVKRIPQKFVCGFQRGRLASSEKEMRKGGGDESVLTAAAAGRCSETGWINSWRWSLSRLPASDKLCFNKPVWFIYCLSVASRFQASLTVVAAMAPACVWVLETIPKFVFCFFSSTKVSYRMSRSVTLHRQSVYSVSV